MAHGPRGLCGGDDRPRARANRLRDRGLHGEADPRRHPLGRNRMPGFEQLVRCGADVRAAAVGCDLREPLRVLHLPRARDLEGPRAEDARARDGSHPVSVIVEGLTRDFEPPCETRGSGGARSEEHTSELQSRLHLVCRLLLEKKKITPGVHPSPPMTTLTRSRIQSLSGNVSGLYENTQITSMTATTPVHA